jgi:ADP-heptose:LPS heptosyltransferase
MSNQLPAIDSATIRRIVVLRALYLGDLLCAVPAFRALRRRFPMAEITLIGLPWAADFVRRLPYVDRLLSFPGYPGIAEADYRPERTSAFLAEARGHRYDLAIQMHGNGSASNGFVAALGARATLGYRSGEDRRLALSLPYPTGEHEIVRWLRLIGDLDGHISRAGHPPDSVALEFPILADDIAQAAELLFVAPAFPLAALHPGAKARDRCWPAERFAALADALIERLRADIVLTGGPGERQLTAAVRRAMHHPALDLAGETDLGTFAAVLARADLVVSNDTGAAHLAAALGRPSVVLFGPGRPAEWGPLDQERHLVIDAWALAGYAQEPAEALRQLPVEPVLAACLEALKQSEQHIAEEHHASLKYLYVAYSR